MSGHLAGVVSQDVTQDEDGELGGGAGGEQDLQGGHEGQGGWLRSSHWRAAGSTTRPGPEVPKIPEVPKVPKKSPEVPEVPEVPKSPNVISTWERSVFPITSTVVKPQGRLTGTRR